MTNFDISRYDVNRICSSSTLIAGDLAKRSSKESPTCLEDYNSSASSASPQPLLAITNGEPTDEFMDMVWSGEHRPHTNIRNNNNNNNVTAPGSRNSSSPRSSSSPNGNGSGSIGMEVEFGVGLAAAEEDYSQAYLSLQGPKYGGENGSDHTNNNSNGVGNLPLVNQVPMFALWNE